MDEEAHWFESGGNRLFGILHRAEDPRGLILILHGFTGNHVGSTYYFAEMGRELARRGFNVFRFDFSGSGNSEGDFSVQDFGTMVRDAKNALEHLENEIETEPLGLLGHSKGGSTAILLADEADAGSLVAWSPVARFRDLYTEEELERVEEEDHITAIGQEWSTDAARESFEYDFPALVSKLEVLTLFVHGEKDASVPPSHSRELHDSAAEPKELYLLENSNHIFMDPDERLDMIEKSADWFEETIPQ